MKLEDCFKMATELVAFGDSVGVHMQRLTLAEIESGLYLATFESIDIDSFRIEDTWQYKYSSLGIDNSPSAAIRKAISRTAKEVFSNFRYTHQDKIKHFTSAWD